ncbi:MAG: hypothetical protein VW258_09435 [Thalassolituus sp.]
MSRNDSDIRMTRTAEHQQTADDIAADIEAFLAKGGSITVEPDDATADRYLIQIDKGLKNARRKRPDKFQFNGAL